MNHKEQNVLIHRHNNLVAESPMTAATKQEIFNLRERLGLPKNFTPKKPGMQHGNTNEHEQNY